MDLMSLQNNMNEATQGAFFIAFIFVLLAEIGDKSQLIVMALSTRYKLSQVFIGVILSVITLNVLAVSMGNLVTKLIPTETIHLLASGLFIFFGILSFSKAKDEDEKEKIIKFGPILTVAITFFVAELGDKTQLATMTLAAQYHAPIKVFFGAALAMLITDTIGLIAGIALNKYIPEKFIRIIAGSIFVGFGLLGLVSLIPPERLTVIINTFAIIGGAGAMIVLYILYKRTYEK